MRIAPIGPFQGIGDIASAAETAIIESTSDSFSPSTDKTVTTTCTSFLYSLGKRGRIDLSISRPVRTASSVGLPCLLTQRLPLIRPPAYSLSIYSTDKGK